MQVSKFVNKMPSVAKQSLFPSSMMSVNLYINSKSFSRVLSSFLHIFTY